MKEVILIGYSGHAFVVAEILKMNQYRLKGYCESSIKALNPFNIPFLGFETDFTVLEELKSTLYFVAVGDNKKRKSIYNFLKSSGFNSFSCLHPASNVSAFASIGDGVVVMGGVQINPLVNIGDGVIINTNATIDHECCIADFTHIAPGAVLTGNVNVGQNSFIGANSVIKPGVNIGKNVVVGAGSVVVKDIPDNKVVMGVPAK